MYFAIWFSTSIMLFVAGFTVGWHLHKDQQQNIPVCYGQRWHFPGVGNLLVKKCKDQYVTLECVDTPMIETNSIITMHREALVNGGKLLSILPKDLQNLRGRQ